jgi:single-strand DNA-binding protein
MDRARFEYIGNVGKLEIKDISDGKKMAVISIATSEKWKPDGHELIEKTYWHRVAVFGAARVALIEKAVQMGTRLRLVGQIRPNKWEDDKGQTRYSVEFIVSGLGEIEILARGKPKADSEAAPPPAKSEKSRKKANA